MIVGRATGERLKIEEAQIHERQGEQSIEGSERRGDPMVLRDRAVSNCRVESPESMGHLRAYWI